MVPWWVHKGLTKTQYHRVLGEPLTDMTSYPSVWPDGLACQGLLCECGFGLETRTLHHCAWPLRPTSEDDQKRPWQEGGGLHVVESWQGS